MTLTEIHHSGDHAGHHTVGWVVSVLVHGSLIVGALLFVQRVQMAPQSEPFTWNVALVSPGSTPGLSSISPSPVETPPPVSPATPSTILREQTVPPLTDPGKSDLLQHKVPATSVVTPPTPSPQAELEPVPQTVSPTPPSTANAIEPVLPAPDAGSIAVPLPVEPIRQTPVAAESFDPSHQTTDSEIPPAPPQRQSDSAVPVVPASSESPTLTSPVVTPSPLPAQAPSIAPYGTTSPPEPAVPAASSAPQVAALAPPGSSRPARVDYGWLSEVVLRRVEELKRYPAEARVDRAEGKVVVKAVINADGSVDDVEVSQSSGSATLDKAAVDLMRRAAPFSLPHSLGKSRVTIKIPMNYRLDR